MTTLLAPQRRFMLGAYLCLLNLYDVFITRHIISKGGHEANPVMAPLVENGYGLALKIIIPVLVWIGCMTAKPSDQKTATKVLYLACLYYAAIAIWNTYIYFIKG